MTGGRKLLVLSRNFKIGYKGNAKNTNGCLKFFLNYMI